MSAQAMSVRWPGPDGAVCTYCRNCSGTLCRTKGGRWTHEETNDDECPKATTASEAIAALELVDRLRTRAEDLHRGDHVVYLGIGGYVRAVVQSVEVVDHDPWVTVTTTDGISWKCSPRNTRCLVVQS